jgi:hypothetical protein
MKKLCFILSLVLIVTLIIVGAGVDDRIGVSITGAQHTIPLPTQIPDEQIHLWSGHAEMIRSAEKLTGLPGQLSTEDFGGSWPGPRW